MVRELPPQTVVNVARAADHAQPQCDHDHLIWSDEDRSSLCVDCVDFRYQDRSSQSESSRRNVSGEQSFLPKRKAGRRLRKPEGDTHKRGGENSASRMCSMPQDSAASRVNGLAKDRLLPSLGDVEHSVQESDPQSSATACTAILRELGTREWSTAGVSASSSRPLPQEVSNHSKLRGTDDDHVLFCTDSSGNSGSESDHHSPRAGEITPGTGTRRDAQTEPQEGSASQSYSVVMASAGSGLHGTGGCRPCLFFASEIGCREGEACLFCHLPHRGKNRPHPSKKMRARYRKIILQMQESQDQEDSGDEQDAGLLEGLSAMVHGERVYCA